MWTVLFLVAVLVTPRFSEGDTAGAVAYLKSKPATSWTIMGLLAAGESPSLDSLKSVSSTKAIDLEAPILAITAASRDPRTFGSTDLVAALKSTFDTTQLGDATLLNDDIFGLLALVSAGESSSNSVVSGTKSFILAHQNGDGGWPYAVGGTSDTNTTAAAIMALVADGVSTGDTAITNALAYLRTAQNSDGGFPYDPKSQWGTNSDASSDSWVIAAIRAAGENPATWKSTTGKNPLDNLQTFQATDGAFVYQPSSGEDAFTPTTTSYAVIALTGKFLPLKITSSVAVPVHFSYRIEGAAQELCAGESDGTTAIDAVRAAANDCGLTYHVQQSSLGAYVDQIATEQARGADGWLYLVNNTLPSVGAADYRLYANDTVVWYYGTYGAEPLRLTSPTSTASGTILTGTVQISHSGNWNALSGATVFAGNTTTTTDDSGNFSLSLPNGFYSVYAEKSGTIRSNNVKVSVGNLLEDSLTLRVTISTSTASDNRNGSGGQGGGTVTFMVDTGTLGNTTMDFGALAKGNSKKQTLTLRNKSQGKLLMESEVTGDEVFRSYLTLDKKTWRVYHAIVDAGQSANPEASLNIPSDYSNSGTKQGKLTFWATPTE